jgi:hypothetical protein
VRACHSRHLQSSKITRSQGAWRRSRVYRADCIRGPFESVVRYGAKSTQQQPNASVLNAKKCVRRKSRSPFKPSSRQSHCQPSASAASGSPRAAESAASSAPPSSVVGVVPSFAGDGASHPASTDSTGRHRPNTALLNGTSQRHPAGHSRRSSHLGAQSPGFPQAKFASSCRHTNVSVHCWRCVHGAAHTPSPKELRKQRRAPEHCVSSVHRVAAGGRQVRMISKSGPARIPLSGSIPRKSARPQMRPAEQSADDSQRNAHVPTIAPSNVGAEPSGRNPSSQT